jgi:replicative DNA helicase
VTIEQIQIVHETIASGDWIEAANLAFIADGVDVQVETKAEAFTALKTLEKNLADAKEYQKISVLLWGNGMFDSRPSVVQSVFRKVIQESRLLIMGGSSLSKCLGPNVGVRMFDGSVKKAKDIVIGDVLMGDDSLPRNVLGAHEGEGPLYEIIPWRGDPWICNSEHILSLRQGTARKTHGRPSATWVKGNTYDIPLKDFLEFSTFRKGCLNQYHVATDYAKKATEYDPYIYGAWLGDGCSYAGYLASPKCKMTDRWGEYFRSIGMFCTEYKHATAKCSSWHINGYKHTKGYKTKRNQWVKFIRSSTQDGVKFILPEYMINDRNTRLNVLAGLIDSDGCLIDKKSCYLIAVTPRKLAYQVHELVRSLGFGGNIYRKPPPNHWTKKHSYHITITGKGIGEIPTLDKRCIAGERLTSNTNIKKIRPLGIGKYNGFIIDGNHRFLLSDYTVTHNTFSCGVIFYVLWRNPISMSIDRMAIHAS